MTLNAENKHYDQCQNKVGEKCNKNEVVQKELVKNDSNDLKYDLKYCVGRMLKLQRKHLLCTQQRQGIQAGHRILENHVKSRQRQYMKKHCERKESNVKKPVEDLTCKHKYEQAVSFTTQKQN